MANEDFEIVDSSSVSFARRGRPSAVNPLLIEKLKGLPNGKAMKISGMALDANASDYKTAKARVSAQIRTACKAAELKGFDIRWTLEGVPMVVRTR
jgi:hypothetical protein